MKPIRVLPCAAVALALAPTVTAAQAVTVTPFGARDLALDGSPTLGGLAVTVWSGAVGLRLGGALDLGSGPAGRLLGQADPTPLQAWTADVDLRFDGRRLGLTPGRLEPGAFVGFGAHALRDQDRTVTVPAWSYGASLGVPLAPWLTVDTEARYRMPHSDDPTLPTGVRAGWELRGGLSFHVGRRGARPTPWPAGRPVPRPTPRSGPYAGESEEVVDHTLATGERYLGVPYVWGGGEPSRGFDCSGFVQYVYGRNGVSLPRVSRDQARAGRRVTPALGVLERGDLLFFAGDDGIITHVALYAGDGWILHASSSRGEVTYDHLGSRDARWYASHLVSARRVVR